MIPLSALTPEEVAAERWASLPSTARCDYEISTLGRVRSKWKCRPNGEWHYVSPWVVSGTGYLSMKLNKSKRLIHRLVLEAFVGPCPAGCEGAHLNGVRTDARLENLKWVSSVENQAHKKAHGTQPMGEWHYNAKVNAGDVRRARELFKDGISVPGIARLMHVSYGIASGICHGRTWRHVA